MPYLWLSFVSDLPFHFLLPTQELIFSLHRQKIRQKRQLKKKKIDAAGILDAGGHENQVSNLERPYRDVFYG